MDWDVLVGMGIGIALTVTFFLGREKPTKQITVTCTKCGANCTQEGYHDTDIALYWLDMHTCKEV